MGPAGPSLSNPLWHQPPINERDQTCIKDTLYSYQQQTTVRLMDWKIERTEKKNESFYWWNGWDKRNNNINKHHHRHIHPFLSLTQQFSRYPNRQTTSNLPVMPSPMVFFFPLLYISSHIYMVTYPLLQDSHQPKPLSLSILQLFFS